MQQTLAEQTGIFLWAFVMGAGLGGVYIVLSVMRILSPPGDKQLLVTDILFVIVGALVNFLFALSQTYGRIRGYVIAAELLSFLVLYYTVGKLLCKSAFRIRDIFLRLWKRLTEPVTKVLHKVMDLLVKKWGKMMQKGKKT